MSGFNPGSVSADSIAELARRRTETYDPLEYEQINKTIESLRTFQNSFAEIDNKYRYLKQGSSNPTLSLPPQALPLPPAPQGTLGTAPGTTNSSN